MSASDTHDALELSLVNDLRNIAIAAENIDAFCARHRLAEEIAFEVNLAVDELLTNTISYGYDDDGEHRIELVLRLEDGALVIEIADDGKAFDPLKTLTALLDLAGDGRALGKSVSACPRQRRDLAEDIGDPSTGVRKPNPFTGLHHFTVATTVAPGADPEPPSSIPNDLPSLSCRGYPPPGHRPNDCSGAVSAAGSPS